jgi:hypothetical protein
MRRDHLIDDVASGLTMVESAPAMRGRVLAAIGRAGGSPRGRAWSIVAAASATAALAVGGVLWQRAPEAPTDASIARTAAAPPVGSALSAPAPEPVYVSAAPPSVRRARGPATPTAQELAWQARAVPALAPPPPLVVETNQPAAVEIPLLDVGPLVTDPLEMAPLELDEAVSSGGA